MPVELRKRPPPKETATPPPTAKRGTGTSTVKKLAEKAKAAVLLKKNNNNDDSAATEAEPVPAAKVTKASANGSGTSGNAGGKISVGETINLDGFGGTVQTHDGTEVTLQGLLERSTAGVVIFTYPRASTPGCEYYPFL